MWKRLVVSALLGLAGVAPAQAENVSTAAITRLINAAEFVANPAAPGLGRLSERALRGKLPGGGGFGDPSKPARSSRRRPRHRASGAGRLWQRHKLMP